MRLFLPKEGGFETLKSNGMAIDKAHAKKCLNSLRSPNAIDDYVINFVSSERCL